MKEYERTFQQWKELAARYFEAETTDAEEEALARFLATPAAQGKEFDELRAVMGYVATGRAVYRKQRTRSIRLWYYAAAAAIAAILVMVTAWQWTERANVCVAYINGERCTDKEIVLAEALKSVQKVRHDSPEETLQGQLSDIFQTLEEGESASVDNQNNKLYDQTMDYNMDDLADCTASVGTEGYACRVPVRRTLQARQTGGRGSYQR